MRLIDADELVKALDEASKERTDLMDTLRKQLLVGFAKQVLSDAPTVDVAPAKQGHWVHKYDSWTCSECYYTFHGKPLWKYCPHCGAKNEVEDGNNN